MEEIKTFYCGNCRLRQLSICVPDQIRPELMHLQERMFETIKETAALLGETAVKLIGLDVVGPIAHEYHSRIMGKFLTANDRYFWFIYGVNGGLTIGECNEYSILCTLQPVAGTQSFKAVDTSISSIVVVDTP